MQQINEDIIILLVNSFNNENQNKIDIDFFNNWTKINFCLSRGKKKIILIGSSDHLYAFMRRIYERYKENSEEGFIYVFEEDDLCKL